jgi:GAF domain-containing protein
MRFIGENVPDETIHLVEEAAARLGLILENTRLLEEAQRLALREKQVNLISTEIRGSTNVQSIMQTTISELGKALGASRTFIQIGIPHPCEHTFSDKGIEQPLEPGSNGKENL